MLIHPFQRVLAGMVHKFASSLVDGLLAEHLVPSFVTLPVACAIFCLFRHPVAISATKYEHARAFYMQGFGLHPYMEVHTDTYTKKLKRWSTKRQTFACFQYLPNSKEP